MLINIPSLVTTPLEHQSLFGSLETYFEVKGASFC